MKFSLILAALITVSACSQRALPKDTVPAASPPVMANVAAVAPPAAAQPIVETEESVAETNSDGAALEDTADAKADEKAAIIKDAVELLWRWRQMGSADAEALLRAGLLEYKIPAAKLGLTREDVRELTESDPYADSK